MTFQPCRSVTNDFQESEWDPHGPVLGGSFGKGRWRGLVGKASMGALGASGPWGMGPPPFWAPSLPVLPPVHLDCGHQHCLSSVAAAQWGELAGEGLAG